MKRRLLPMVLVCCMLSAWLAVYAHADDIVASGNCGASGSSVQWSLDSKGTLTISGTGVMGDYNIFSPPWSSNRTMITSITASNGITGIGQYAFENHDRLTKVVFPDSLIRIKERAFSGCSSLTKITLPDSVTSIEDKVFQGCSNLLSFTVSDGVTNIGASAFQDCDRLTKMVVPKSVSNISKSAFSGCDRLQSVTILGDISTIKAGTFQNCPALTEVTIPDSVLIMEQNAFSGCAALKDIYFTGTESLWNEISVDGGNTPLENATLHADTSPEAAYRINGITVSGGGTIPDSAFFATVSLTNYVSGTTPLVFLAAYSGDGQFRECVYVTVKEPIGATVEVSLPVDNSAGNIARLKAFVVSSFDDLTPVGNIVSYP